MSATHSTEANNKLSQVKGYAKKFYARLRKKLRKSNRFYVEKWKEQHVCYYDKPVCAASNYINHK